MKEKEVILLENLLYSLNGRKAEYFEFLSKKDQLVVISIINDYSKYLDVTFAIMHDEDIILPYYKRVITAKEYGNYARKLIKESKNIIKKYKKDNINSLSLAKK